jgi:hypothetical protein
VSSGDEDFYTLLEVGPNATFEEIENAYQRVASALGPESLAVYSMLDEGEVAQLRSKIDLAYRTLSDPDRRSAYDGHRDDTSSERLADPEQYPSVMVPQSGSEASVTMGHMSERAVSTPVTPAPPPPMPEPMMLARAPEPMRMDAAVIEAPPPPARAPEVIQAPPPVRRAPVAPPPARRAPVAARPILAAEASDSPRTKKRRYALPQGFDLPSENEMSGAYLKRLRTACEVNIEELAEITKIGVRHLRALEDNDFDALPAQVYVRGFVAEYARVFGLDPELVAKGYLILYKRYRGGE